MQRPLYNQTKQNKRVVKPKIIVRNSWVHAETMARHAEEIIKEFEKRNIDVDLTLVYG